MTTATMTQARTFRDAMASFPSGVTIVTTSDEAGRWRGFTATSFSSVSMDPPLVLTCLATSAECYSAFTAAQSWVVHFIETDQTDLAMRFATRGADKFAGADFTADENGLPILGNAHVTLRCSSYAKYPGGDHLILVGRVEETEIDDAGLPAIYFRRNFHVPPLRIEGTQV